MVRLIHSQKKIDPTIDVQTIIVVLSALYAKQASTWPAKNVEERGRDGRIVPSIPGNRDAREDSSKRLITVDRYLPTFQTRPARVPRD